MLLIIDNGSKKIKKFATTLNDWNVSYQIVSGAANVDLKNIKGIILSGGSGHPEKRKDLQTNYLVLNQAQMPILGICLGHEIIAHHFGGKLETLPRQQLGLQKITMTKTDQLFSKKTYLLEKKHYYHVAKAPENFEILGKSAICAVEIIKHKAKPIYGIQGHPEISIDGIEIMRNFIRLCGV